VTVDKPECRNEYISHMIQMPKIDSHAHLGLHCSGDLLYRMLGSVNMKWLSVCWGGTRWEKMRQQIKTAKKMHAAYPDRIAWATSFNLTNWSSPDWEAETTALIADGFAGGAVAVKVWKEIGMSLKEPDGSFVMIDNPRFGPIFDYIQNQDKTLVAHIGEPKSCWLPLDSIKVESDRDYYSNHPAEHCYQKPEIPGYQRHLQAMDRVLGEHPDLRVVWCHLASLESDTAQLAARFERYPNLAVDLAARINHLQIQGRNKIRDFIIKYQDRILYGTDIELHSSSRDGYEDELRAARDIYISDLIYFSTEWEMEAPGAGETFRGLALPVAVLEKIFFKNTEKWYPGI